MLIQIRIPPNIQLPFHLPDPLLRLQAWEAMREEKWGEEIEERDGAGAFSGERFGGRGGGGRGRWEGEVRKDGGAEGGEEGGQVGGGEEGGQQVVEESGGRVVSIAVMGFDERCGRWCE